MQGQFNWNSATGWESIPGEMKVVKLTIPLTLLIPALILPSLSKGTRGLTLYPGLKGLILGIVMVVSSMLIGLLLSGPAGPLGMVLPLWTMGSIGIASIASGRRPTAFVKPICVKCRLLPIIKEHEAIHLTGVASESAVWASMKTRHSLRSLKLVGDPAICAFCPIPKRLAER